MRNYSNKAIKRNARIILNQGWTGPVLTALIITTLAILILTVLIPFASANVNRAWNLACGAGIEFILLLLLRLFVYGADEYFLKKIRKNDPAYRDLVFPFQHQPDRFLIVGFLQVGLPALYILPIIGMFSLSDAAFRQALPLLIIWSLAAGILFVFLELSFAMAPLLLLDNPKMGAGAALASSRKLMMYRKRQFLFFVLSFLPYLFLLIFTAGIGWLWIRPYFMMSEVCFYESLAYPAELPDLS